MVKDIIKSARSFRRFSRERVSMEILEDIIETARFSQSTANIQAIRYILVNDEKICNDIFKDTKWAGYLEWNPELKESPTAYIVILRDKEININDKNFYINMGIASQNITLALKDYNLSSCMIGAFNKENLINLLYIDKEKYELELLIAIGKANEEVKVVDIDITEDIKYYRKDNIHFVPKIKKEKLIIKSI